ncbi:MAG TPA: peptide chain release factor N(5)-glutamine methyltransferase [Hansschlegelia sp.]
MEVDRWLATCGLPRNEALILLAHATGLRREQLIAGSRDPLDDAAATMATSLAGRRRNGEPIAYLVGHRDFYGRAFAVDRRVLIPRPETELLVDLALEAMPRNGRMLDLGTGSGAIAITMALERPGIDVVATDRSADALAVARGNAARLGAAVRFAAGDWYTALTPADSPFDAICANPPYVAAGDRHLDEGDLRFEPSLALTDGADGLAALRIIVAGAATWLAPGGIAIVEHGHDQAAAVRALFVAASLENVASRRDIAGIERISFGTSSRVGGASSSRL